MLSLPDFKEKSIVISFATEGQAVSFKNDNLIVKDGEGKTVLQHSCYRIFTLWIIGGTTITSGIIQRSKKFGFSIYLFSYSVKLIGVWNATAEGNFLLREKQYQYKNLDIAWHIVKNKIENQTLLLKSIRDKSLAAKTSIADLEKYQNTEMTELNLKTILGTEGISSRVFFKIWFADMDWKGRKPRAKIDKTNVILDIGYTYLFNIMEGMLNLYGFDVYKGIYHQSFYQRKSLVCDLVEPFRCIIDRKVKNAHGLGQIKEEDFTESKGQFFLKIDQNKKYTSWIVQEIMKYKEEMFLYTQSYYRAFMRSKPIGDYPTFKITE
ncbi:MAG: type V CRISPR-associated endonuclease Cas1 [Leptospiraceae bacterium]|nr:type V CRISPR-associated endonuclease Cas1 [Leptospiraceae bacterium]